ncbi:hypothetical protein [Halomontanus rarus]|uniref:hypothetical protein n=1 Tax=Halomontanus rarus TaxID=3034020 RepID=UPI001A97D8CF
MTDDCSSSARSPSPSPSSSRRRFLGAAVGTAAMAATAGCLDSVLSTSGSNAIEPEEPSTPRNGSPGEFYYFLEDNGITVESLTRADDDLSLTYRSDAETVEESDQEIVIIYEVYKQALIHRGSDIGFLYAELSNPFDGQALGWGINSEWIHRFDSQSNGDDAGDVEATNETDGESEDGIDMNRVTLWNNIMNTKVYQEDVDAVGAEADNATTASVDDNSSSTDAGNETEGDD